FLAHEPARAGEALFRTLDAEKLVTPYAAVRRRRDGHGRLGQRLARLRHRARQHLRRLAVLRLDVEVARLDVVGFVARRQELRLDGLAVAHDVRAAWMVPAQERRVLVGLRLTTSLYWDLNGGLETWTGPNVCA